MSRLIETWLLKTIDGSQVFIEPSGKATLEGSGSNVAFEFRKGEHPTDNKEAWAKKISDVIGVDLLICACKLATFCSAIATVSRAGDSKG
jgi:hypothetical protein